MFPTDNIGYFVCSYFREMTEMSYHQENSDTENLKNITLDPRAISPLDRARSKRHAKQKPLQLSQVKVFTPCTNIL